MSHLLMIESWVGASGRVLPPLLKSLGHTYTLVTRNVKLYKKDSNDANHPVIEHADEIIVAETNDVPLLIELLRQSPKPFDGVITVCDYYIETVREVAIALQLPCPFPEDVTTVRYKHLMREALDRADIANPSYRLTHSWTEAREAAEKIGYPLVFKPVDLASSAFVSLVHNEQELKAAYDTLEEFPLNFRDQQRECAYLLENYMVGEEVSVESVSCQGETTILGITDKSITGAPYFIENGHMFPAQLNEETYLAVTQYVREVLKAVNFDHGIAHTEVKITASGPRIIEINPRTAGNYIVELVQRVTSIDLLQAFVELSLGHKPAVLTQHTGISSAAVMFLIPPHQGVISCISGVESLQSNPHVARYSIENCGGQYVETPIDNACYLGHVITQDRKALNARKYAEQALSRIELKFESTVRT